MTNKLIPELLTAGYVETAPACGDCMHCSEQPHGVFCDWHYVLLPHENGRCYSWSPSNHWLRANPPVAQRYVSDGDALSPAELAYANKDHTLPAPAASAKRPKWPFPTA